MNLKWRLARLIRKLDSPIEDKSVFAWTGMDEMTYIEYILGTLFGILALGAVFFFVVKWFIGLVS